MYRSCPLVLLLLPLTSACGWISFEKKVGGEEYAAREEIRVYYLEVQKAFALRDHAALAALFDPSITKPMTQAQIQEWGRKFFAENQAVSFHIDKLSFDDIGPGRAVVLLTYHVTTSGGKGDFGGTEADELQKRGGRWRVTAWEKR